MFDIGISRLRFHLAAGRVGHHAGDAEFALRTPDLPPITARHRACRSRGLANGRPLSAAGQDVAGVGHPGDGVLVSRGVDVIKPAVGAPLRKAAGVAVMPATKLRRGRFVLVLLLRCSTWPLCENYHVAGLRRHEQPAGSGRLPGSGRSWSRPGRLRRRHVFDIFDHRAVAETV